LKENATAHFAHPLSFGIKLSDATYFDYQFTLPRPTLVETIRASGQTKGKYETDPTSRLAFIRAIRSALDGG
jgi:hypothetical protein